MAAREEAPRPLRRGKLVRSGSLLTCAASAMNRTQSDAVQFVAQISRRLRWGHQQITDWLRRRRHRLLPCAVSDLSVLYYTASRDNDQRFTDRVRTHLATSAAGHPIVSVSQRPLTFGANVCVGEIGASHYNVYWQILVGARAARTEYVACCEDDCLYTPEHFRLRPADDTIAYNRNRWWIEQWKPSARFRFRDRIGMWTAIAPRELLVRSLEARFALYPDPLSVPYNRWCEPGRRDERLGVPKCAIERPSSEVPILTFNHRSSLGGMRRSVPGEIVRDSFDSWGTAAALWRAFVLAG